MAVVILGGLMTSTLLNLFLLPPIYAAFGRVKQPLRKMLNPALAMIASYTNHPRRRGAPLRAEPASVDEL